MFDLETSSDAGETAASKLRLALELHEAGVDMMRCKLQREHPGAPPAHIEAMLADWLAAAPAPGAVGQTNRRRHPGANDVEGSG